MVVRHASGPHGCAATGLACDGIGARTPRVPFEMWLFRWQRNEPCERVVRNVISECRAVLCLTGLTGADVAKAAALKLGKRLVTDLHVGAGGALPVAEGLFAAHAKGGLTDDAAVNLETNAATHHHGENTAHATVLISSRP